MKHKIEKNTVQETLILPLYSRKLCTELYPNLYQDETAVRLIDEIDQAHRCFILIEGWVQFGTQFPGIQRKN